MDNNSQPARPDPGEQILSSADACTRADRNKGMNTAKDEKEGQYVVMKVSAPRACDRRVSGLVNRNNLGIRPHPYLTLIGVKMPMQVRCDDFLRSLLPSLPNLFAKHRPDRSHSVASLLPNTISGFNGLMQPTSALILRCVVLLWCSYCKSNNGPTQHNQLYLASLAFFPNMVRV